MAIVDQLADSLAVPGVQAPTVWPLCAVGGLVIAAYATRKQELSGPVNVKVS